MHRVAGNSVWDAEARIVLQPRLEHGCVNKDVNTSG